MNRPGHAFTGDGFDISAGVANGKHAMTAQMFSPAGKFTGAIHSSGSKPGGDRLMT
jgi:hypothetical protein